MSRIITLLTALVFVSLPVAAQERVQPSKEQERMLSELLPDSLAGFVVRTGADRPAGDIPSEALENLYASEPDLDLVLEVLQPKGYVELGGPVTLLAELQSAKAEDAGGAAALLLVAGTNVRLQDGVEVEIGTELVLGDILEEGIVLNAGGSPVLLELPSGALRVLHVGEAGVVAKRCVPCSVTCGAGYYACCYQDGHNCCHCGCKQNGTSADCSVGGGPGATACSCGAAAIVDG